MKQNKLNVQGVAIVAILFVVYTLVVAVVPGVKNAVYWVSYLFTVLALAAQVYIFYLSFAKEESVRSKYYGFPIANIGVLYLLVQFVVSTLFMLLAKWAPLWLAVVLGVVILGAASIGLIAADAMRDEVERQDVKLEADVTAMRALQSKIGGIVGLCGEELRQEAEKLAEEFRFSDPISSDATKELEHELDMILGELQSAVVDGDSESAKALFRKASVTLIERNRLCKLNK